MSTNPTGRPSFASIAYSAAAAGTIATSALVGAGARLEEQRVRLLAACAPEQFEQAAARIAEIVAMGPRLAEEYKQVTEHMIQAGKIPQLPEGGR